MKRQKRIALVNDITGFGRCSVAVELPLISAMKVQACPLPTAILSVHTGFPHHFLDDYTDRMKPYIDSWEQNHLAFDGIATGFLGSAEQIDIVIDFIRRFKQPSTRVMVDPVMGDYGKLYSSYTEEMCVRMRKLLAYADIVTPNLTEACQLLGRPYPAGGRVNERELAGMAKQLADRGPSQVVITGLSEGDEIENYIYEAHRGKMLRQKKIGGDRSGSGDAFAAIVSASLINGDSLEHAVRRAADFISKCLAYAVELDLPWNYGLPFEEYLTELR
ncbi:MAG: pyridoxamine kinase [Selenomonadaceae bacterium]|nr:pyridoxamine kinase [Selenomonadaceae bacterium]MDY2685124.1 pyridoxamine kinase [Selenomonadaceae bacterium]